VGELQARDLSRLVPRGKYVVLAGAPTDNNATLLHYGAMKVLGPLAQRGDIQIVVDQPVQDWEPEEAARLMENAVVMNNGGIQAVLAPNDGTAGGVIKVLAYYKLAGRIPVTGQDAEASAARRIMEGTQSMTVFKDTRQLASAAFGAAMTMANGGKAPANSMVPNGKMDVPALLLDAVAVDKDNLAKVLIESGYLTREQVYGKAN
jgi:D-xylose transport system substrate-binding protein